MLSGCQLLTTNSAHYPAGAAASSVAEAGPVAAGVRIAVAEVDTEAAGAAHTGGAADTPAVDNPSGVAAPAGVAAVVPSAERCIHPCLCQ